MKRRQTVLAADIPAAKLQFVLHTHRCAHLNSLTPFSFGWKLLVLVCSTFRNYGSNYQYIKTYIITPERWSMFLLHNVWCNSHCTYDLIFVSNYRIVCEALLSRYELVHQIQYCRCDRSLFNKIAPSFPFYIQYPSYWKVSFSFIVYVIITHLLLFAFLYT